MYTQIFIDAQNKVNELQIAFKNDPSKTTATPLAQARVELEKVTIPSVKYTKEFRATQNIRTINSITQCMINAINN